MVQADSNELILGISVGATNICAGIYNQEKDFVDILESDVGKNTMPSQVGLSEDGAVVVGERAHAQKLYIEDPVRLVGESSQDTFEQPNVGARTPTQLVSEIIKAVKNMAERKHEGKSATKCVISVPSYFEQEQKAQIEIAAFRAGLECMEIIDSAFAAVAAAGLHRGEDDEQTVLVCDYGGSDLTISVVKISFGNIEKVTSKCERNVGGRMIDEALVTYCL